MNDGWEPDWDDRSQKKWHLYYDHTDKVFAGEYNTFAGSCHVFPYLRTGELATQLIKDYPAELRAVWGLE